MTEWYQSLNRPLLTPPSWVFGPVWAVLYAMIAAAIYVFVRSRTSGSGYGVYVVLGVHLAANFAWTAIFFRLHSPGWALIDILVLDATLICLVFSFWRAARLSSVLLWPYLAWVLFATYLNAGFYLLNRN